MLRAASSGIALRAALSLAQRIAGALIVLDCARGSSKKAMCVPQGAQSSTTCAPASTCKQYLFSREHKPVVPGAQTKLCLCLQEHKPAIFVLPGAQRSHLCAPRITDTRYLCSWEHNHARVLPAGAQTSLLCAPAGTGWWEGSEKSEERGDLSERAVQRI